MRHAQATARTLGRATVLVATTALLIAACDGFTKVDDAASDAGDAQPPPSDATPRDAAILDALAPADAATDSEPPPGDAALDAADAATARCVPNPVAGQPCAAGATACGEVDLCCSTGEKFRCTGGVWESYSSPALCLLCAPTKCGTMGCPGNQYCVAREDVGGTVYQCVDYPAACSDDWTCGCVAPLVPTCAGGTCTAATPNHLSIACPP